MDNEHSLIYFTYTIFTHSHLNTSPTKFKFDLTRLGVCHNIFHKFADVTF